MQHYEMRLLAEFIGNPLGLLGPAQAANTWQRPTPQAVGGELEQDERAEVVFAEIVPPVSVGLADEELRRVTILLDGTEYGKYISLSGIRSNVMATQEDRSWNNRFYSFGKPHTNNPLENTTLKYSQNVTVACLAGPTAITNTYRVRLWGYVYKTAEIPGAFGTMVFPAAFLDRPRQRAIPFSKNPIVVNGDNWLTLPGGKDQAIPKINPFARFAYNLLATDGQQGDYQFRRQTGNVSDELEDMYYEYDEKDALLVKAIGISPANDAWWFAGTPPVGTLARTGLRIGSDYHPKGPTTRQSLYPTDSIINQLQYGLFRVAMFGFPLPAMDMYLAIPKLDQPYLIWNEIGTVVCRDDGTAAVAANSVVAALTGIRIEMRG